MTDYRFSTFTEDEIKEISQALRGSGDARISTSEVELQEIINALQETTMSDPPEWTRDIGDKPAMNIAVIGESGSGKSTFVNVLRGFVDDEVEGAAKTGVVETTKCPTSYPHPKYKNVTLWDLPGTGTPGFNLDDFLKSSDSQQYDFFILMASGRVRHNDMEVAKVLQSRKKKFFFIRNKIDCDLRASKLRRKQTYNEEKILRDIQEDCIKHFTKSGVDDPCVFLLSCLELEKYDFALLEKTLEIECIMPQ